MRITQRAVALTSLQGLNRNLDTMAKLQQQLTSGRLITNPSDSPTGTNRSMQTRSSQASVAQYARNISDGQSWLGQTDSTLQQMLDTTRKVRDLTVQGSNEGGMSDASRKALATEVANLRESRWDWPTPRTRGGRCSVGSPPARTPTTPRPVPSWA
jgi:flagellin-like hook-associated protein FlgL